MSDMFPLNCCLRHHCRGNDYDVERHQKLVVYAHGAAFGDLSEEDKARRRIHGRAAEGERERLPPPRHAIGVCDYYAVRLIGYVLHGIREHGAKQYLAHALVETQFKRAERRRKNSEEHQRHPRRAVAYHGNGKSRTETYRNRARNAQYEILSAMQPIAREQLREYKLPRKDQPIPEQRTRYVVHVRRVLRGSPRGRS